MTPLVLTSALLLWSGLAVLLAEVPWIARTPLRDRIGPYIPGVGGGSPRAGVLSVESFREALGPLARLLGARVSRILGIHDEVERRLDRVHAPIDVTAFRIRQLGWSLAGAAAGVFAAAAMSAPAAIGVALASGGALGAFVAFDHRLTSWSRHRQVLLRHELPVVAEQIGMLLSSGWSLGAALQRIARRGAGDAAADLRRVVSRIGHGVDEHRALAEWADVADVDAVTRLVAALSLERQATDMGRLITNEARSMRRDLHRGLLAQIERRGQQVWIPVTVATLLPGAIFIAIPFTAALDAFLSN